MKERTRGFTLAELLIVIAIIAVLVAVAVPVISAKVEKAREAYDVYTMRQAASLAVDLYYQGINDATSAANAGMKWWPANVKAQTNAAGIYDPKTGKFRAEKSSETKLKPYGKGTEKDGGTLLVVGNANGAYQPSADYTNGIVMVSIFPYAKSPYIDVYWKDKNGSVGYIGGQINGNTAKHSLRIYVD